MGHFAKCTSDNYSSSVNKIRVTSTSKSSNMVAMTNKAIIWIPIGAALHHHGCFMVSIKAIRKEIDNSSLLDNALNYLVGCLIQKRIGYLKHTNIFIPA